MKFKSGLIQTLNSNHLKELNVAYLSRVYPTTVVFQCGLPHFENCGKYTCPLTFSITAYPESPGRWTQSQLQYFRVHIPVVLYCYLHYICHHIGEQHILSFFTLCHWKGQFSYSTMEDNTRNVTVTFPFSQTAAIICREIRSHWL